MIGKKNEAIMSTKVPLDYETKNQYKLWVKAFNKNAEKRPSSMEETCEITITVNDVNEPPIWEDILPEFHEGDKKGKFWIIPEPSVLITDSGATSLNNLNPHAVDKDVEFPSKVSYKIIEDLEHYFDINPTTGVLTVVSMLADGLDRECKNCADGKYTLTLEACDEQK